MPIGRQFLGWDRPALHTAAEWLLHRHPADELAELVVVLPTQRAGRLLEARLVETAGRAITPPTITTVGQLPELLCPPPSEGRVATETESIYIRMQAVRAADPDGLARWLAVPPASEDLAAWWVLARRLHDLSADLAATGLGVHEVIEHCERTGFTDSAHPSPERWAFLTELDERYRALLAERGWVDRQAHRLTTLREGGCAGARPLPLLLLAVPDLTPLARRMVRQWGENGGAVEAWVHAEQQHAEGFDDVGGLRVGYWKSQPVPLDDADLHLVDRETDMPDAAARLVLELADGRSPDDVSLGLGEPALHAAVQRSLELADVPSHWAAGRPIERSLPMTLLDAMGRFLQTRRLDDFAALLRHPDAEAFLTAENAAVVDGAGGERDHRSRLYKDANPAAYRGWLGRLDRYAAEFLHEDLSQEWRGRPTDVEPLIRAMQRLLDAAAGERVVGVGGMLLRLYEHRAFRPYDPGDAATLEALRQIAEALEAQASLAAEDEAERVASDLPGGVALLIEQLRGTPVPEPRPAEGAETGAIELMGLLEMPLDDAPVALFLSLNEGRVPAAPSTDPLLPDAMRRCLGLPDAVSRFARDKLQLMAAMAGRERVALLAARRTGEGDPLVPSRLLLACPVEQQAERLKRFTQEIDPAREAATPPLGPQPGGRSGFLIPYPEPQREPLQKLRVTAFRDYLACPYRFYLQHVLGLEAVTDEAVELDGMQFGTLAHAAVEPLHDLADVSDPGVLYHAMAERVDELFMQRFRGHPRVAVMIQQQQLLERLKMLAEEQAKLVKEGWRIHYAEREADDAVPVGERPARPGERTVVTVDGEPFTIIGRIDRIDVHPTLGVRLIDYKTSDTAQTPEQAHRDRDGNWTNLQLPLYRHLAAELGLKGRVAMGYFNLPRDLDGVKLEMAEWTPEDLAAADATRDSVIRKLRKGCYWPPSRPGQWADDYSLLAADAEPDRGALIRRSEQEAEARGVDARGVER